MKKIRKARLSGTPRIMVWESGKLKREFPHIGNLIPPTKDSSENSNIDIRSGRKCWYLPDVLSMFVRERVKPHGTPRKLPELIKVKSRGRLSAKPRLQGLAATYNK